MDLLIAILIVALAWWIFESLLAVVLVLVAVVLAVYALRNSRRF